MKRGVLGGAAWWVCAALGVAPGVGAVGTPGARAAQEITVRVAVFGAAPLEPASMLGVQARLGRANATDEIPGVRVEVVGAFGDGGSGEAAAVVLADLASPGGSGGEVLAVVGESSAHLPARVADLGLPVFGAGRTDPYCRAAPGTGDSLWVFSFAGCALTQPTLTSLGDAVAVHDVVAAAAKRDDPSMVVIAAAGDAPEHAAAVAAAYRQARFFVSGVITLPGRVDDWRPVVQQIMTGEGGEPLHAVRCLADEDCVGLWGALRAAAYPGVFVGDWYDPSRPGLWSAAVSSIPFVPLEQGESAAIAQLRADVEAQQTGAPIDGALVAAYLSTDQFLAALRVAASHGAPTRQSLRAAAASLTWQVPGLAGPTTYPTAASGAPSCVALVRVSEFGVEVLRPFGCA